MGHSKCSVTGIMKFLITIAALFAIAECRRHLCDDGTRPICNDGSKAVYNRPTGKNTDDSKYFPPPVCNGEGQGAMDKPFAPCADGSKCVCPGGGKNCQFHYRVCGNGQGCRKMCRKGQPHCPWWTKNRNKHDGIREFNTGDSRPGNKGHNWGPDFAGNQA